MFGFFLHPHVFCMVGVSVCVYLLKMWQKEKVSHNNNLIKTENINYIHFHF